MIHADMNFFEMTGLAMLFLFAAIGLIAFAVMVFRVMNSDDTEYYEEDEYDFHGWENPEMIPVRPERKAKQQAKKQAQIEYINLFEDEPCGK